MARDNNRINVSELDFAQIKSSLINYLSGQTNLKDYNFQGSALNTLTDLLAYDTHYNAIIANMLGNEMFIDSAVARASVVSKSKELNYVPKSKSAATAIVSITVTNVSGNPDTILLPKNTTFQSSINGATYSFITLDTYTASNVSNAYTFNNVKLYEGVLATNSFVAQTSDIINYTIPNVNVDISTLKVLVQNSATEFGVTQFNRSTDITSVSSTSPVFFVQGYNEYEYQIHFGDGIIGKQVNSGNIIIIEYVITNGSIGNNAIVFKRGTTTIAGSSNITVTTLSQSSGGKDEESIESIKFNAPRSYTAQNRLVTPSDYKTILTQEFNNISSINVWGGEDNIPADYGSVYICIQPTTNAYLSELEKNTILNYIVKSKKMIGTIAKIVDSKYLYIQVKSTIYYNINLTSLNQENLKALVSNTVKNYADTYLNKFEGVFRYSKMSAMIDNSDPSIVSNITEIAMHQYLVPVIGTPASYEIKFYNPIYKNEFGTPEHSFYTSRGFKITGDTKSYFLEDDGEQYIRLFYYYNLNKIYVNNNVGTIDYVSGTVVLYAISISSFDVVNSGDNGIQIVAVPQSNDIVPVMNMILQIKESDIVTNAIIDPISSGYDTSGANYTFTESR